MSKENYHNPFETPNPEMMLEMFEQLDPSEAFFTKEQRMKALDKAAEVANVKAKETSVKGEQALDILYDCYKEELKKISN
jgi:hypothetical protein